MIFVLCGPGGVGKGSIARGLVGRLDNLVLSRSWTTRPRRPSESDSDYRFSTHQEFESAIAEGLFLEWARFNGEYYGTPKPTNQTSRDLLLEIDAQGAHSIRSLDREAVIFVVVAPDDEELRARMRSRGDAADQIERRIQLAHEEVALARQVSDFEVVNTDLDEAIEFVAATIEQCRSSRGRSSL
ncbi:MAG: guanylate kinase [Acidimicrobiales bacterium]